MSNEQFPVKSRLFNLREWLTVPETARHLSSVFCEDVTEADILRLALDGHLKLSVNFVNPVYGKCGKLISYDDEENLPAEFLSLFENIPEDLKDNLITGFKKIGQFENHFLDLDDKVTAIEGVWDLPMVCGQRYCIQNEYQKLTGGPKVDSPIIGATFVVREGAQVCRLHERFNEPLEYETPQGEKKKIDFQSESDRYYPLDATGLPSDDSVLVVRTQAIHNFLNDLNAFSSGEECLHKSPLLDSRHRFHAKELKIAVEAWTELYQNNPPQHVPPGGHKKYITNWIEEKYPRLGQRAKDRIATIINPNPKGGASPTS